jgi:hypothetical protein
MAAHKKRQWHCYESNVGELKPNCGQTDSAAGVYRRPEPLIPWNLRDRFNNIRYSDRPEIPAGSAWSRRRFSSRLAGLKQGIGTKSNSSCKMNYNGSCRSSLCEVGVNKNATKESFFLAQKNGVRVLIDRAHEDLSCSYACLAFSKCGSS